MKIAIFTDSFLPGVGGTEKAVLGLANALSENNKVVVCAPYNSRKYKDDFGFQVLRANSIKITNNDYFAFPFTSHKFKKALNEFNPEIIHCQSVSPMARFAIHYAKKHNIPVVMTVHTKFKTAFERSIKSKVIVNALIKNLVKKLNKVKQVYTVSNDMIDELKSYGYHGEVKVIRNGATFNRINNLEDVKKLAIKKYNLSEEENIFLYVGHIVKFKNLEFTINALKILKDRGINFKMLFVGHGFDDDYFKNLCKKLGLHENVIFTGQITDKDLLSSLYGAGELFLFPSIFDNDPLTIVEAALHHVPAITIKNTGSSERITNNVSGFVVENNVQEFANKIMEVISDKPHLKQIGDEAEKTIPKDWDTTAEEYLTEYCKVLTK
ncbi:MAG: glycosyltransferase [Christensenellales bacterium]